MAIKRIKRELDDLNELASIGWSIMKNSDDFNKFLCNMKGPENSSYSEGVFDVDLVLPYDYPFKAPKVKFLTKIYHPNISNDGDICMQMLGYEWSPKLRISDVFNLITELLKNPNPSEDFNNIEAANLLRNNPTEFSKAVYEFTKQYACID